MFGVDFVSAIYSEQLWKSEQLIQRQMCWRRITRLFFFLFFYLPDRSKILREYSDRGCLPHLSSCLTAVDIFFNLWQSEPGRGGCQLSGYVFSDVSWSPQPRQVLAFFVASKLTLFYGVFSFFFCLWQLLIEGARQYPLLPEKQTFIRTLREGPEACGYCQRRERLMSGFWGGGFLRRLCQKITLKHSKEDKSLPVMRICLKSQ